MTVKKIRRALVIEDLSSQATAIQEGLAISTAYRFEVDIAQSPAECLSAHLRQKSFDVIIIDLHLYQKEGPIYFGHRIIETYAMECPGAIMVVYSAFDDIENISLAIKRGATRFVSKKKSPHELASIIEQMLKGLEEVQSRLERLDEFVERNSADWSSRYRGKTLAIVNNEVVVVGDSRLDVLVKYHEKQMGGWPIDPELVRIPEE